MNDQFSSRIIEQKKDYNIQMYMTFEIYILAWDRHRCDKTFISTIITVNKYKKCT